MFSFNASGGGTSRCVVHAPSRGDTDAPTSAHPTTVPSDNAAKFRRLIKP
jgi:hypothetical protein